MDLREYIEGIKSIGELRELTGADWNLEIGVLTEMVGEKDGPALLFDEIKDYPRGYRVLSNMLNNPNHIKKAFGFPPEITTLDLVRAVKERMAQVKPLAPQKVSDGPVLENVQEGEDVDLLKF